VIYILLGWMAKIWNNNCNVNLQACSGFERVNNQLSAYGLNFCKKKVGLYFYETKNFFKQFNTIWYNFKS